MVTIEDPTPDPKLVRRHSCNHCGTRLQYFPGDIKKVFNLHAEYGSIRTHILCPKCNKLSQIS